MCKIRVGNVLPFIAVLFLCVANSYAGSNPPYFGMSKQQYDECIVLGSRVMEAQNIRPDSPRHKAAYDTWYQKCGMPVMLPLAKKYGIRNIPASPLEWSQLR